MLYSGTMVRLLLLLLACSLIQVSKASESGDWEPPKAVVDALVTFNKTVGHAAKRAAAKATAALEAEVKRRTQAGDLETALAGSNALQSIEAKLDKFRTGSALPSNPVGRWYREDGRVLVIEGGGKGTIFRGKESPEPLQWRSDGDRYALTFPTLTNMPGIVTYIWPDNDGAWSYAFTDGKRVGGMKKMP